MDNFFCLGIIPSQQGVTNCGSRGPGNHYNDLGLQKTDYLDWWAERHDLGPTSSWAEFDVGEQIFSKAQS
ncbi:hypothetical protein TSUD_82330 [Trifolium subterraneum]|uniref:Uncharacterized protein n=1 Tax=Trifolium subterraneum TaxID=3900 RepID=A0A2Z6NLJ1_TRISU|nr:hypothetical protein TSUD_82330 [Trifolium subterraneum]